MVRPLPVVPCPPQVLLPILPSCPHIRPNSGALEYIVQEVQRLLLCLQVMMRVLGLQAGRLAGIHCLSSLINCTF